MENLFIAILASLAGLTHTPTPDIAKPEYGQYVEANEISTEVYITDAKTDCKVFNPYPQDNETIEWSGDCKDGYAYGEGVVKWYIDEELLEKDSGTYDGGRSNGYFTIEWYDDEALSAKFIGEMLDGERRKGMLIHYYDSDLKMYSGDWQSYDFHGQGMSQWADGSTYTGGYENGAKSGYGVFSLSMDDKDSIAKWKEMNQGNYQGGRYNIEGIFKDDDLVIECKKEDCPAEYFE